MPKKLEEALKRSARRKGLTGKRFRAYVYGNPVMQKYLKKKKKKK